MTGRLRIHLVHQGFGDYVGGLVDGIHSLGADEVELAITTITSGTAPLTDLRTPLIEHRSVALPRFRDPRSALLAGRAVRDVLNQSCDVIHWQAAGNPWVDFGFYRWLRKPRRRPAVLTVHDMRAHPGDRSVLPGTFPMIRQLVRRADHTIVHAEHVREQAVASGADPGRVSVMPHGELASVYLPAEQLPLLVSNDPRILFFGRAQWYKGLDVVAAAMETVAERIAGATLVVAGSGPSIDEVFPPDQEQPPWVELHRGKVDPRDVPGLFASAAVVVLPYREASQSGVAALAAGFGRPVVASRLPGLVDSIEDDVSGLLVAPGDSGALADRLTEVLSDAELAARLSAGAYQQATTTLSWSSIAHDHFELYRKTLESIGTGSL